MFLVNTFNRFIRSGEKRNDKIKKNIAVSFIIRGLSVAVNFSIVPLTIQYVEPVRYGIWITVASLVSWFTFFDLGMGNGLRNQLATAVAIQKMELARKYVSTTYALLTLIALSLFLLFYFVNPYINWRHFLNVPSGVDDNMQNILLIVLGVFCIQFVAQVLNTVFTALQEPAKAELLTFLGQAALLITLVVLKSTSQGSLVNLVLALNAVPVLVLLLASVFFYSGRLRSLAPSLREVDFSYAKTILNTGGAFFLIQIGALILFQTDNVIITRILGPGAVTEFNVTYKLYSLIIMGFSIIANPYWSAFTDAFAKGDYQWISSSVKKLREIWFFTLGVVIPCFFLVSKYVFQLWLPGSISIPVTLSVLMAVYAACYTCLSLNCYFLNGVGKLRVQLLLYLLVMTINIPTCILFCRWWGLEGVVAANILAFIFMNVVLWVQTNKIVSRSATGIWNA